MGMAVEHVRKFHDIDLLGHHGSDELRALVRCENEPYWTRIASSFRKGR